jgi:uncharacterized membrane protein
MPEESVPVWGGAFAPVHGLIEAVSLGIELLAIIIIVVGIVSSTVRYAATLRRQPTGSGAYETYRERIRRALLLGLEILLAADVIRTVALEPTLSSLAALGLLVLIRTFLSWSLVVEIEGRWPWQARRRPDA